MRVLFGMILGAALIVGTAFVVDTWSTGPSTSGTASSSIDHRTMVNWDVVGENLRFARERAHEAWTKLSQKVVS